MTLQLRGLPMEENHRIAGCRTIASGSVMPRKLGSYGGELASAGDAVKDLRPLRGAADAASLTAPPAAARNHLSELSLLVFLKQPGIETKTRHLLCWESV